MSNSHSNNNHSAAAKRLAEIFTNLERRFVTALSRDLAKSDVSFSQYLLLSQLMDNDLMMSQISKKMGHTTAASTGLVDRLEKWGFATRAHSVEDRRKVFVSITRKGRAIVDKVKHEMTAEVEELLGALSAEETRMWLQIYEKISNLVEKQDAADPNRI